MGEDLCRLDMENLQKLLGRNQKLLAESVRKVSELERQNAELLRRTPYTARVREKLSRRIQNKIIIEESVSNLWAEEGNNRFYVVILTGCRVLELIVQKTPVYLLP
jgi:hypothetical protein